MSFEISKILKECLDDMRTEFPSVAPVLDANYAEPINYPAEVERFKILIQPHFMAVESVSDGSDCGFSKGVGIATARSLKSQGL